MQVVQSLCRWQLWLLVTLSLTLCAACGGGPKAQINKAVLTRAVDADKKPLTDTLSSFAPSDPAFHLAVDVINAPAGTKVKATWYAVSAGDSQNEKVDEAEVSVTGSHWVDFSLTRQTETWPKGSYKVELALNGKNVQSIDFTVS